MQVQEQGQISHLAERKVHHQQQRSHKSRRQKLIAQQL
jgi:hypothetical protein